MAALLALADAWLSFFIVHPASDDNDLALLCTMLPEEALLHVRAACAAGKHRGDPQAQAEDTLRVVATFLKKHGGEANVPPAILAALDPLMPRMTPRRRTAGVKREAAVARETPVSEAAAAEAVEQKKRAATKAGPKQHGASASAAPPSVGPKHWANSSPPGPQPFQPVEKNKRAAAKAAPNIWDQLQDGKTNDDYDEDDDDEGGEEEEERQDDLEFGDDRSLELEHGAGAPLGLEAPPEPRSLLFRLSKAQWRDLCATLRLRPRISFRQRATSYDVFVEAPGAAHQLDVKLRPHQSVLRLHGVLFPDSVRAQAQLIAELQDVLSGMTAWQRHRVSCKALLTQLAHGRYGVVDESVRFPLDADLACTTVIEEEDREEGAECFSPGSPPSQRFAAPSVLALRIPRRKAAPRRQPHAVHPLDVPFQGRGILGMDSLLDDMLLPDASPWFRSALGFSEFTHGPQRSSGHSGPFQPRGFGFGGFGEW